MEYIFNSIRAERERQHNRWGEQNHNIAEWQGILMEEVVEAAKEAIDFHFKCPYKDDTGEYQEISGDNDLVQKIRLLNYRNELIQVAAVAVQMIECLDRNGK